MKTKEDIKGFIEGATKGIIESDKDKWFGRQTLADGESFPITNNLHLVLEWVEGYGEEPRTDIIQSTKDPNYALCYKIAKRNNLSSKVNSWEDLWDDVTESNSFKPNYIEHLNELAEDVLKTCKEVQKKIDKSDLEQEI